jgi:sugar lactone lactonase YvrE
MTAGHIYDLAGNGLAGYTGDGGLADAAELTTPNAVAIDGSGNVLISDAGNDRIRVVAATTGSFYGQSMTAGDIYTVAGDGSPFFSGDDQPALDAGFSPTSVTLDPSGNVLITDGGNDRIRVVAATTGSFYGQSMTAGDIYTVAGNGTAGFSGDGGPGDLAELREPEGIAADQLGNLVIADSANNRIRVVAAATGTFYGQSMTAGDIYTIVGDGTIGFSGDGGPALDAELGEPAGVAVDGAGNVLIADYGNNRIRVVAAATGTFYGQSMTAGDIYTIAGSSTSGFAGDGGPATSAELQLPQSVAVDGSGNFYIDDVNGRIREVTG